MSMRIPAVSLLTSLFLVAGCGSGNINKMHRNDQQHANRIKAGLEALLLREGKDRSVIFQERKSEKFVQFAGSTMEPLLLDLPSIPLSAEEMARAKTFFAKL